MNFFKALDTGYNLLKLKKINSYKIDTELLLSASLNISKEKLLLNLKQSISLSSYKKFMSKLKRREAKEKDLFIFTPISLEERGKKDRLQERHVH